MVKHGALHVQGAIRSFDVGPETALCYTRNASHAEHATAETVLIYLAVQGWSPAKTSLVQNPRLVQLAEWICQDHRNNARQLADHHAASLILELQRRNPSDENRFTELRNFLRRHPTDSYSVDDLARRAHLSKFHFIRSYKAACGCTPMQDLLHIRLGLAANLLLTTDLPLKAVAEQTGFCDEYYFSRAFKKHYLMPPGAFRRRS